LSKFGNIYDLNAVIFRKKSPDNTRLDISLKSDKWQANSYPTVFGDVY